MEAAELQTQHEPELSTELEPERMPLYLAHARHPTAERCLSLNFAHRRDMLSVLLLGAFVAGAGISLMTNSPGRQMELRGLPAFGSPAQAAQGLAKQGGNGALASATTLRLRPTIVVARPTDASPQPRAIPGKSAETPAAKEEPPSVSGFRELPESATTVPKAAPSVDAAFSQTVPPETSVGQTNADATGDQPSVTTEAAAAPAAIEPKPATQEFDPPADSKAPIQAADAAPVAAGPSTGPQPKPAEPTSITGVQQTNANGAAVPPELSTGALITSAAADNAEHPEKAAKEGDGPSPRKGLFGRVLGFVHLGDE